MKYDKDNKVPDNIACEWGDVLELQVKDLIRALRTRTTKCQKDRLDMLKQSLDCIDSLIVDYKN